MRTPTINLDYYQLAPDQMPTVEMPSFLIDIVEGREDFTILKGELLEVFTTYFNSEDFKGRDDTSFNCMLFTELNKMFDNIYLGLAQCKNIATMNEIKEVQEQFEQRKNQKGIEQLTKENARFEAVIKALREKGIEIPEDV
jgi:predicted ribosome quality control (RQC) complex YloA/Tae2 family protein